MNCLDGNKSDITSALMPSCDSEPPLGADLTIRLREAAKLYYLNEGGCHGLDHSERVHATVIHIGNSMKGRLDILSASALLHDIGRNDERQSKGTICHALKGAELARKILAKLNFEQDDIEKICHCIATHRFRDTTQPESLEAKILFDADKLDSIGAIGVGRAFLFAGQVGARLHNHNIKIENTDPYTIEDTAYREFRTKLCRIRDRMLTPIGRQLADDRHRFMEFFFSRLEMEITGDVRDG
jgi:uncharacterized protein